MLREVPPVAPDDGRAAVRLVGAVREDARVVRLCVPVAGVPRTASWLVPALASAAPRARLEVLMGPDDGDSESLRRLLESAGPAALRMLPSAVPLAMVVDGDEVVVPGVPAGQLAPGPFRQLVDALWDAGRPVAATRPAGSPGRTLELLASGLTDRVAAAHLNISERTYRRQVAELMDRLGARSRFEAGVRAAARGWVDEAPRLAPADAVGS